jgi:hypothetical protein
MFPYMPEKEEATISARNQVERLFAVSSDGGIGGERWQSNRPWWSETVT